MTSMTQEEKFIARMKQWIRDAQPAQAMKITVVLDRDGRPVCWWCEEPIRIEGNTKPDVEE